MNIEIFIAKALIRKALARGWSVSVIDGEEETLTKSRDFDTIWKATRTTDEDYLVFFDGERRIGQVWLIYGNGEDLISDYSDKPEIEALVNEVAKIDEEY